MSLAVEEVIGFRFRRPELLRVALTHRSFSQERRGCPCNERMEFLGDSILSAIVAHRLYELHPQEAEGRLSKRKAALVSRVSLTRWARELRLGEYLYLGAGEEGSGGRSRPSMLANALEALIGAIYLDGGFEAASAFVDRWLRRPRGAIEDSDSKSRLQEILQKRYKVPPQYTVDRMTGPEHDKTFVVTVRMGRVVLGSGAGKSKKEAEQAAAKDALARHERSCGRKVGA